MMTMMKIQTETNYRRITNNTSNKTRTQNLRKTSTTSSDPNHLVSTAVHRVMWFNGNVTGNTAVCAFSISQCPVAPLELNNVVRLDVGLTRFSADQRSL